MDMDRREFLRNAAIFAAGLPLAGKALANGETPPPASAPRLPLLPHVQLLSSTSMGIVWRSNFPATGRVEWTQDDWQTCNTAWTEEDGLLDANGTFHRAILEGIDPARPLKWRVRSLHITNFQPYHVDFGEAEDVQEGELNAILPADGTVSWAMFNDVHQNLAVYDHLVPHLAGINTFCVFNGDIVNHVDDAALVEKYLLAPLSRVSLEARLPVWYLRGNHETRGAYARNLRDHLSLKEGHFYGAATLGNVRFVFLDTGEDKTDRNKEYSGLVAFDRYLERQRAWLAAEVASPEWRNARARIVTAHIPAPTTIAHLEHGKYEWKPGLPRLDALFATLAEANVTLFLGAHLHNWNWHAPIPQRPYPMLVGGGPELANPNPHKNATLAKCTLSPANILSVNLLSAAGEVLVSEEIHC
ncbi:MAG: metallophosphoesterase [Kiritimatiellae bacterium]|nr:metallophosphoesterase [Kiritimatiellia bacterium]